MPPRSDPPPALPPHLAQWQLPPGWAWGGDSLYEDYRHFQEVVDALGRSLSLVSVPNPAHADWLLAEARALAHRNHPAVPTTYHYWAPARETRRGPGYLRRWIAGEPLAERVRRQGPESIPAALRVLREAGAAVAYVHDGGAVHGGLSGRTVWLTPSGRLWLLGWQWAIARDRVPPGIAPDPRVVPPPPEQAGRGWQPTALGDQWQLGALAFLALTGEAPPAGDVVPPLGLVRPEVPRSAADVIERALDPDPARRFPSVTALVRALDRGVAVRPAHIGGPDGTGETAAVTPESRLRWAAGDDYDVLAPLGSGGFGAVWRVRDLQLGREVALKMLHPRVARDAAAVARFRREATLAAQLAHPAIVPIFDFEERGGTSWYTMELAEGGSVADLVKRAGPRPLREVAPQVEFVLEGLAAAHAVGVVHRDLKPENLLIDRYRRWRVADFGIASALGEEAAGNSGTPAFAPPEQLLGEAQGPPADVFALAAIVYAVLTGRPPFPGADGPAVLAAQLGAPPDVSEFPAVLAEWLRTALAADAERRYPDAAAALVAWRRVRAASDRVARRERWWRRTLRVLGGGVAGDGAR